MSFGSTGGGRGARSGRQKRRYTVGKDGYDWHILPSIGMRVELSPHRDEWMQGDRCGYIRMLSPNATAVKVKLDKSLKTIELGLHEVRPV